MKLGDITFALRHSIANRGLLRSIGFARRTALKQLARSATAPAVQKPLVHPFDVEFGTDTGGMLTANELSDARGRRNIYNTAYYATPPSLFLQAIARLDIDFSRFTFIDLGAGKGRVLLLASGFPFQQVIGVEFSRDLALQTAKNIAIYQSERQKCAKVSCLLGDAAQFAFPPGPLVIFMWNPFVGHVFEGVLANLEQSLRQDPREVYLLYLKPDCAQRLEKSPLLGKIWECTLEMSEEDFDCYEVGGRTEVCAAYRSLKTK